MTTARRTILRNILPRRGADRLPAATSHNLAVSAVSPAAQAIVVQGIEITADDPLFAYCLTASGVIEIDRLTLHSSALDSLRAQGMRLLLPLVSQGELVGAMSLGERLSEQEYSGDDLGLLNTLARQAATTVRVAQLARIQQIEARHRERMEQELKVAGVIQQTLLPNHTPDLDGWHIAAYWQPARSVGGDFYDFIPLADGRLAFIIADVSGKGVPAALVMASTRSILRAAAERLSAPGEVLSRANNVLCGDIPPNMFVTCLCAVLDTTTGRLQFANAGHNLPFQHTADRVIELRARGMPLGLMPGMDYEEKETTLAPNDHVVLYSDGLIEAHNPQREMFGTPRFESFLSAHLNGDTLVDDIVGELHAFAGASWEQEDDVTLVVLNRDEAAREAWQTLGAFEIASEPGNERGAMEQVAATIADLLPPARLERLKTAIAESTMNAMEHGNHYQEDQPVHIQVERTESELRVRVIDNGGVQGAAPPEAPDLEAKLSGLQSPRGWGLFLIKNMVDDLRVHSDGTLHTVELIMKLEEGDQHAGEGV